MFTALRDALGPSACNWLIVIGAGLVFLAAAAVLPTLIRRWRGRNDPAQL